MRASSFLCLVLILMPSRQAFSAETESGPAEQITTVVFWPRREATLSSEISAPVENISRELGETFRKGDTLIELDSTLAQRNLEKAGSYLRVAKSALDTAEQMHKARTKLRRAEAEYKLAKANLEAVRQLHENRVRIKIAEAEADVAKKNLKATEKLYRDNIASTLDLEKAQKDVTVAAANLELTINAEKTELAKAERTVTITEADVETARLTLDPNLEEAKRDLAVAEANFSIARKELDACTIRAPFNGRVVKLHIHEHELPQKGQDLLDIVNDQVLLAQFLAPSKSFRKIKLGQAVRIEVIETEETVTGRISHINAVIDPASESFMVHAEVDNREGKLRSGMRGRLNLLRIGEAQE